MYTLDDRADFRIESLVRRNADKTTSREYNCDMRRLYPWPGIADTKRPMTEYGVVWVTVRPGDDVDAHRHDEEETFIVVSGTADLEIEGQVTTLGPGDVAYVPRYWQHQLRNRYDQEFQFVDIYWDDRGRSFEEVAAAEREGVPA